MTLAGGLVLVSAIGLELGDTCANLQVRISFEEPRGAVPVNEYVIDMAEFRESVSRHDGTLVDVAREIAELTKKRSVGAVGPQDRSPTLLRLADRSESGRAPARHSVACRYD